MATYTKLFSSILDSTIWQEDAETRIVWVTLLAMVDRHGEVRCSVPGLVKRAGVSRQGCEKALAKFLAPDPDSSSKEFEGRRIQVIDGGWWLINHDKYRRMADQEDQKAQNAERQRRFKERQRLATASTGNAKVTQSNDRLTKSNDKADADADTDTDTDTTKTTATTTAVAKNSSFSPPPGQTALPAATPPGQPLDLGPVEPSLPPTQPQQDLLRLQAPRSKKPAKPPKVPKPAAGARYPSLQDPARLVNAWTVWIDFLRDRGFPNPAVDPKDTTMAKTLGASIESRQELEWILNAFVQDDDDQWLAANFPHQGQRPLRLISSRIPKYRLSVAKARDCWIAEQIRAGKPVPDGAFQPYTYGTFIKNPARPDPADATPPTSNSPPDGKTNPNRDPADAFLAELESQT
jgi:hypothetical protein